MGFIQRVLDMIDSAVAAITASAYGTVAADLVPLFQACAVLVVALIGINIAIQAIPLTLRASVSLMVRISLVWVFLSSWTNFNAVFGTLTNFPSELGAVIMNSLGIDVDGDGLYAGLDRLYESSVNAGQAVAQNGGIFAGALGSLAVFAFAVIFSAIAVVVIGYSKLALAVMIVLAPAAIICTMFRQTAPFFEAWVKVTIQAALIPALMAAVAGVVIAIADEVMPADISTVEAIGDMLGFLFVMVLGTILVIFVPSLAQSLAPGSIGIGGIAASTSAQGRRLASSGAATVQSGGTAAVSAGANKIRGAGSPSPAARIASRMKKG
jgi:type IV secretion system protein VirB6